MLPIQIANPTLSQKTTVAALGDSALLMPDALVLDRNTQDVHAHGIPQPNAAPGIALSGAGTLIGDYIYTVTFLDTDTGEFGQGSATATITATNNQVTVDLTPITNEAVDSRVDEFQIWRTVAGGTVAFLVDTVSTGTGSYVDNNSDASISTNRTLPVGLLSYTGLTAGQFGFCIRHADRIFAFGAANYYDDASIYKDRAIFSAIDDVDGPFPNAFPLFNKTFFNNGEHLRSATGLGDYLLVFQENDVWLWTYLDDPHLRSGNGRLEPLNLGRGAVTFKSVINVDGIVYALDKRGIYRYDGGQQTTDFTEAIRNTFDRINWDEVAQISGSYDDKHIMWAVPMDGSSECNHALVLDRQALQRDGIPRWWVYRIPHGIRDLTTFVQGASTKARALGHANCRFIAATTTAGYEVVLDQRVQSDGVHPEITKSGTVDSDATVTFTDATATFEVGLSDLAGMYVILEGAGTPNVPLFIASSTATTFSLAAALPSPVLAGSRYIIGAIETFWESGMVDIGGPQQYKQFERLGVVMKSLPLPGNSIRVSTRNDRKAPFVTGREGPPKAGYSLTQYREGALVQVGGRNGTDNREGYVEIPIHGHDARQLQVRITETEFETTFVPWQFVGYYVGAVPKETD